MATLDAQTVESPIRDVLKKVETRGVHDAVNPTALLVNLRHVDLQAHDIACMIKASGTAIWTKIALLLPLSPLNLIWVKRLSQNGNHAFFKDGNEATDWISA